MKPLTEMNNRELFAVLAGDNVIQQVYLQKIIRLYLRYAKKTHYEGDVDLQTMVAEFAAGKYGSLPDKDHSD